MTKSILLGACILQNAHILAGQISECCNLVHVGLLLNRELLPSRQNGLHIKFYRKILMEGTTSSIEHGEKIPKRKLP